MSTTWTTDSGASEIAATCSTQPSAADAHADREPLASDHSDLAVRSGWRMSTVAHGAGAAVLVEESEVRGESAEERQQDAEVKSHGRVVNAPGRATMALPSVDPVIGSAASRLDPSAERQAIGWQVSARSLSGKNAGSLERSGVRGLNGVASDTRPADASMWLGRVMRLISFTGAEPLHLPVRGRRRMTPTARSGAVLLPVRRRCLTRCRAGWRAETDRGATGPPSPPSISAASWVRSAAACWPCSCPSCAVSTTPRRPR